MAVFSELDLPAGLPFQFYPSPWRISSYSQMWVSCVLSWVQYRPGAGEVGLGLHYRTHSHYQRCTRKASSEGGVLRGRCTVTLSTSAFSRRSQSVPLHFTLSINFILCILLPAMHLISMQYIKPYFKVTPCLPVQISAHCPR